MGEKSPENNSSARDALDDAVNRPVKLEEVAVYVVMVGRPGGIETLHLSRIEIDLYNNDPDAFAGRHFGLSKDDYREWVTLYGYAYCGERTKKGHACRNIIGGGQRDAEDWQRVHRAFACSSHGGDSDV